LTEKKSMEINLVNLNLTYEHFIEMTLIRIKLIVRSAKQVGTQIGINLTGIILMEMKWTKIWNLDEHNTTRPDPTRHDVT